jgi:hypothetical protein
MRLISPNTAKSATYLWTLEISHRQRVWKRILLDWFWDVVFVAVNQAAMLQISLFSNVKHHHSVDLMDSIE